MNSNKGIIALAGAGLGIAAYFYLTNTEAGRDLVDQSKSRLDDYLAGLQDRIEQTLKTSMDNVTNNKVVNIR